MRTLFEIIGYIGTALVILSMTMTSVRRLRLINVIGSAFSTAYAIFGGAWPIVLMNLTLSAINIYHLTAGVRHEEIALTAVMPEDITTAHFMAHHRRALLRTYADADARMKQSRETYILYRDGEMVGLLATADGAEDFKVLLAYASAHADRVRLLLEAERIGKARRRGGVLLCESRGATDRTLANLGYLPHPGGYRKAL